MKPADTFRALYNSLWSKSNRASKRPRRRRRRLRSETLESRQMLAADLNLFQHNYFDAEDVNDDGIVSPVDALAVLNAIQRNQRDEGGMFTDVNNDGRRGPIDALRVLNRINRGGQDRHDSPIDNGSTIPDLPDEVRSIDGTGNNLEDENLGAAGTTLLRVADADYADGISEPGGEDRPSAREISNVLSDASVDSEGNDRGLSAFLYVWGQFIDHDIDLSLSQEDGETFDIAVPAGDPYFDPSGTGDVTIGLSRSVYDLTTGTSVDNPREQVNAITAYIDGSQVYGSDQETADGLRSFEGGRLVITDDGLLPLDESGMVIAGDIRASENISLTAIQTLFAREHNRLADEISAADPDLTDEEIYQQARAIVIAEIQSITYNEFLPALLGNNAIDSYDGYDASVNPSIANEFSTAAFRFGHSTLNDDIEFFDNDGLEVRDEISLTEAFFNPSLLEETGIDSILKYDASSQSMQIDLEVVDSLRNFLFGPPGAGGFDLVSLNIQRGRDHGLADYNSTRVAYGLDPVESFADITSDVELQGKLESLYGDVNNIDLWVGLLAEDHVRGASVGETHQAIISDQFERIRDGDRFWYENVFEGRELKELQQTTLADIIERNTNVEGLQENVFFMNATVSGTVTQAVDNSASNRSRSSSSNRNNNSSRDVAVEGVELELLDDEGNVIDSTTTDRKGSYRFSNFVHTGEYQIRVAETGETLDLLVSNGATRLRGLDFEIVV
ncbi:peroxidase family protein [Rosistilla oblonga]|uniref:peroxidase family protein n=1 Tax=Rosistilla oblonga TaxID=2527990 RepID=UPI003A983C01